jgi:thymidine phosphorylase
MKLKVTDVDLAAGGAFIVILGENDAIDLDLKSGDRVLVKHGTKEVVCIVNISENGNKIKTGRIGVFEEVLDKLNIKHNATVDVSLAAKPESVKHIRRKLFGHTLADYEFKHIVDDITNDRLTDVEKTYFVSACFTNGLTVQETVDLTKAIVASGDRLKFSKVTLDKHCIGGIPGNRTTMVVIPIIAALGFTIPKTSSRAITSPAGTADTMECLAKVEMPEEKIKQVVKKTKACIVHGGAMNLAPADDKLIKVRHPLSLDPLGMMLASVMGKKYSVSANHVLIDIPVGKTAKVTSKKEGLRLKKLFKLLGKKLGMNVDVILTDGRQPIGNGIGPYLESIDVMSVLKNDPLAPQDLHKKSVYLATQLLMMMGMTKQKAWMSVHRVLDSCEAHTKMLDIIKAQGKQKKLEPAKFTHVIKSKRSGKVREIDNHIIAKAARIAGAPEDKTAGLFLHKKIGMKTLKGDPLYTLYAINKPKLQLAIDFVKENNGYLF